METRQKAAEAIAIAAGTPIELPTEKPVMEFVGDVGRRFELSEGELGLLGDEFLKETAETGQQSRWTLSQAFTASASKAPTFQRRHEIQEIGWKVLKSPIGELLNATARRTGRN